MNVSSTLAEGLWSSINLFFAVALGAVIVASNDSDRGSREGPGKMSAELGVGLGMGRAHHTCPRHMQFLPSLDPDAVVCDSGSYSWRDLSNQGP